MNGRNTACEAVPFCYLPLRWIERSYQISVTSQPRTFCYFPQLLEQMRAPAGVKGGKMHRDPWIVGHPIRPRLTCLVCC
jgi:hypothetical protein